MEHLSSAKWKKKNILFGILYYKTSFKKRLELFTGGQKHYKFISRFVLKVVPKEDL